MKIETDRLILLPPDASRAGEIEAYRAAFPADRMRVTYNKDRIPGLDRLEEFEDISDWLRWCETQAGRISFFMLVRERDGRIVGFSCLRHSLSYDDDDPDFASHIGYSILPSEQGKGYGKEQLRLVLERAAALGLPSVRLVCRDENTASRRIILANGGVYLDSIYGEESGLTVCRYDIPLPALRPEDGRK